MKKLWNIKDFTMEILNFMLSLWQNQKYPTYLSLESSAVIPLKRHDNFSNKKKINTSAKIIEKKNDRGIAKSTLHCKSVNNHSNSSIINAYFSKYSFFNCFFSIQLNSIAVSKIITYPAYVCTTCVHVKLVIFTQ